MPCAGGGVHVCSCVRVASPCHSEGAFFAFWVPMGRVGVPQRERMCLGAPWKARKEPGPPHRNQAAAQTRSGPPGRGRVARQRCPILRAAVASLPPTMQMGKLPIGTRKAINASFEQASTPALLEPQERSCTRNPRPVRQTFDSRPGRLYDTGPADDPAGCFCASNQAPRREASRWGP